MRKLLASLAAASLIAAPMSAFAAPASPVNPRSAAPAEASEELGGATLLVGIIAAVVLVVFVVLVADDDEDDPVSA